jgi:uncharacterized protein YecT (DUF1311 family)
MLLLGVAHAANEGTADHWPAYPMPASDAELEAYAAHQKLRPSYVACLRKGGEVEDAVACIRGEYDHQDRRLDQAFRQLSARMAGERRAQLAAEQGRWSRWRDARCGREEIEVAVADCMLEMAADRATQLEERMAGLAQDSDPAR